MTTARRPAKAKGIAPADVKAVIILVAVTVLCHLPVLNASFAWDDYETLVQNPTIDQASLLRYFDLGFWRESHAYMQSPYRPVREVALVGLWRMGARDRELHAVNLALHTVNVALAYAVALMILGKRPAAFAAAMVFSLHPSNAEVQAFTKNIGELGSVLFSLVSVICFIRATRGGRASVGGVVASAAALALGLLTKEVAVAVPFILTAWALLRLRGRAMRTALVCLAPLWLMAVGFAAFQMRSSEIGIRVEVARTLVPTGIVARSLLVLKTLLAYAGLLLFPIRYVPWHEFSVRSEMAGGVALAVVVGALAVAALWLWTVWRWRAVALAMFWAFVAMGPAANVVINTGRPLAEQRLYLPSVGFGLLLGALVAPLLSWRWSRNACRGAGLALCVTYAVALVAALGAWRHTRALWVWGTRQSPGLAGPCLNLGDSYTAMGEYPVALSLIRKAQQLERKRPGPLMNIGAILGRMGRLDESTDVLDRAVKEYPKHPGLRNNVGNTCYRKYERLKALGDEKGARVWLRKAMAAYEKALEISPYGGQPHINLGNAYFELGELAKARESYGKALALDGRSAQALYNLARVDLRERKWRDALDCYERAAKVNPHLPDLFQSIAELYARLGKPAKSAEAWRRAVAQGRTKGLPGLRQAANWQGYAAALARAGRPREARAAMARMAEDIKASIDVATAKGASPVVLAQNWSAYAMVEADLGKRIEAAKAMEASVAEWRKALEKLRKQCAPLPRRAKAWLAYTQGLSRLGRQAEARPGLKRIADEVHAFLASEDAKGLSRELKGELWALYSQLCAALGRREEAGKAWRKAKGTPDETKPAPPSARPPSGR